MTDQPLRCTPFSIAVGDAVLADLSERIDRTRWPDEIPGLDWQQGTDLGYLRALLAYWAEEFDWPAQERRLNSFDQFRVRLDDTDIHFVHERAPAGNGIPLILTHGWPSSFAEYLPLVPLLTDPGAHGIDGPAFDVVIPSLPGYGFSQRPARTGVNYRYVADLWHRLMQGLGHERYGAGGGDFGAGVSTYLALDYPEAMLGLHLSNLEIAPYTGPGSRPLSAAEQSYLAQSDAFWAGERGYKVIQSTKPQTLGYGLNDSPAGLAAWIVEKWRSWGDTGGDVDARLSRDFLLTNIMIYWVTQTITSSTRDYYDNRVHPVEPGPADFVSVPTAVADFAGNLLTEGDPPREWAERLYNIRRWTAMPSGGHFAAAEEPERLARDISAFFAAL